MKASGKRIFLRDVVIKQTGQRTSVWYPETLRLIEAIVEIDGKPKRMTFITDTFTWAASSICDLYKARWAIEVFFKEIKQTLQLSAAAMEQEDSKKRKFLQPSS